MVGDAHPTIMSNSKFEGMTRSELRQYLLQKKPLKPTAIAFILVHTLQYKLKKRSRNI